MIEWKTLTSTEISKISRKIPVLLPIGLVEAHGPHLATSVDCDTAEYFARRIAGGAGAILAPLMPYGFADEMAEYPGTIGLTLETATAALKDLMEHFCFHGFKNILVLSGHGANQIPFQGAIQAVWRRYPEAKMSYWNYWSEAGYNSIAHADQGETEIALAVGTRSFMEQVQDFKVQKPWYRIRSRAALCLESGGVNGSPSLANREQGQKDCDNIVQILTEKLKKIVAQESA